MLNKALLMPILAAVVIAVYANSLGGEFVFDDRPFIVNNPNIRSFDHIFARNESQEARPTTFASLALNYAIGELDPFGYHVTNLLIHLFAALILFVVIHNTLRLPLLDHKFESSAPVIAFIISLIWASHPFQSECVAYVFQRSESLQALFYLLAVYCYTQSQTDQKRRWLWILGLIAASALGMGSKSTFLTLPVTLALFGRIFLHPTWIKTAQKSGGIIVGAGVAITIVAVSLTGVQELALDYMKNTPKEAVDFSMGYATHPLEYYQSQPTVILNYLKLAFWPDNLCLDYRLPPIDSTPQIILTSILLLLLLIFTGVLLKKHPPLGFCLAFMFLLLAPTSLYWRLDLMFTYRMYLPLAGLISFLFFAGYGLLDKYINGPAGSKVRAVLIGILFLIASPLCARTVIRNRTFQDPYTLFKDGVETCPNNPRGQYNLANQFMRQAQAFKKAGKKTESHDARKQAIHHYQQAIRHFPHYKAAHTNLATALSLNGDLDGAIFHLTKVVEWDKDHTAARLNLAQSYRKRGINQKRRGNDTGAKADLEIAAEYFRQTLIQRPRHPNSLYGLGTTYYYLERFEKAAERLETYVQNANINPDALRFLADALFRLGNYQEAKKVAERHLSIKPTSRWSKHFLKKMDAATPR